MKTSQFVVALLAGFAAAAPLETRAVGTTANEFTNSGCKSIIFFFARGSTEVGNMVRVT
jgi:cutinase